MENITKNQDLFLLKDNKVIGNPNLINSKIHFSGKGNILICKENCELSNVSVYFNLSNSLVFLDDTHIQSLAVFIAADSVFYLGSGNFINNNYADKSLTIHLGEGNNVFIGNNGMFSFGIHIRTSDPHLIYDAISHKRISHSNSIFIGDHVWLGQEVLILKGTQLGSGLIIGAKSVVSNKQLASNCSYGGENAKKILDNIFFLHDSSNFYSKNNCHENEYYAGDEFVFSMDESTYSFLELDKKIKSFNTSQEKLVFLQNFILEHAQKNRFYIS